MGLGIDKIIKASMPKDTILVWDVSMGSEEKLVAMDEELAMLSTSFWEELEKIKELLDENPEDEECEVDEEKAKYGDDSGIKEELQKYQKRLKVYAERLGEDLKAYGERNENMNDRRSSKTEATEPAPKNPRERGHKLGCGCPGCTAYRDFYGIKLYRNTSEADIMTLDTRPAETWKAARRNYAEENRPRPCGGRLHNFFHGERAELKNVLGRYTRRFNFGLAGY